MDNAEFLDDTRLPLDLQREVKIADEGLSDLLTQPVMRSLAVSSSQMSSHDLTVDELDDVDFMGLSFDMDMPPPQQPVFNTNQKIGSVDFMGFPQKQHVHVQAEIVSTETYDVSSSIAVEQPTTSTAKTDTPLPDAPIFLEKYSSFYCKATESTVSSAAVLAALCGALKECQSNDLNVDVNLLKDQNKIKGCAFIRNAPVSFAIQLYKKSEDCGDILVECQRRSGDSFSFQSLYRGALGILSTKSNLSFKVSELVPVQKASPGSPDLAGLDYKNLPLSMTTISLDKNTTELLVQMAHSTRADVKTEAVHALVDLCAKTPDNISKILLHGKATSLFQGILTSKSVEVQRCGSRILFMAAQADISIPSNISDIMLEVLHKHQDSSTEPSSPVLTSMNDDPFIHKQFLSDRKSVV